MFTSVEKLIILKIKLIIHYLALLIILFLKVLYYNIDQFLYVDKQINENKKT
jgi:hypothetical protein